MELKKLLIPAMGLVAGVALVGAAVVAGGRGDGASAETPATQRGISVSGIGEVTIRPDTSWVDVGVTARADSVEAARNQAAEAMNKVIEALKAQGIAENDIQTTSFNISPEYDYSSTTAVLRGYVVSNTVSAKVTGDAGSIGEKTGKVIDAAAAAAGNTATVNGVRFGLSDDSAAMSDARKRAVEDARSKAQELAGLANVKLGDVTFISESGSGGGGVYYAADAALMAERSATPIEAGRLTVTASVSVTWAIQ